MLSPEYCNVSSESVVVYEECCGRLSSALAERIEHFTADSTDNIGALLNSFLQKVHDSTKKQRENIN